MKKISLRKLAENAGLSPSDMIYIASGINASTTEVYVRILRNWN